MSVSVIDHLLEHVTARPHTRAAETRAVRVGPFWTVVHTSLGAGMASTMTTEAHPHQRLPVADAGHLHRRGPIELTHLLRSPSPIEAAVGLATINALIGFPKGELTTEKAVDILLEKGCGKTVAMIGRFPFTESLRPVCDRLMVFERGRTKTQGDYTAEELPHMLPSAEIVAITATTLLNGTLGDVLQHVAPDAWTMMLGPSTPMAPCLFEHGFDALCGTVIDDVKAVLAAVTQGAVTKQIDGVRRLCLWRGPVAG